MASKQSKASIEELISKYAVMRDALEELNKQFQLINKLEERKDALELMKLPPGSLEVFVRNYYYSCEIQSIAIKYAIVRVPGVGTGVYRVPFRNLRLKGTLKHPACRTDSIETAYRKWIKSKGGAE